MSVYTDARSIPGKKGAAGVDERELFLRGIANMLLEAHAETVELEDHVFTKSISGGQSERFPILGRKRQEAEHVPGEIILGGGLESNEVEISLDNMMYDAAFLAEIDELMLTYDIAGPYARQLGESLAVGSDKRRAIMHVLAARTSTPAYTGGPAGKRVVDANMRTDPAKIEAAYFDAVEHINTNDISGKAKGFLPWKEYLLLSRYTGIDSEATSGSGDRSTGTTGLVAGIKPKGIIHIPNTNITTGPTKYRGNFTNCVGFISTEMAVGRLKRRGLKLVIKKQDDRLGTLMIASQLEGNGVLRQECAVEIATS